jgi:hypothetical protein
MFYWVYVQGFKLGRTLQDIFCPIRKYTPVSKIDYPWLWIGAVHAEDNVVNVTEIINNTVKPGYTVDRVFLENVTGMRPITWKYLDTTLNEIEFPEEGITIPDDSE